VALDPERQDVAAGLALFNTEVTLGTSMRDAGTYRAPSTAKGRGWCATRRSNNGVQHPRFAPGDARALRRGGSDSGESGVARRADDEGDAGDLGTGRLLAQVNQ
jgi:hypothetical protein